ncbi:hypoxia up-regulated protein 1-like [Artemia franciscana]|uniref:hypoxia up-regulated protein 1-like n=1 Tax=Artemia franciscana TaxID=6661 RepID=UPI0032DB2112
MKFYLSVALMAFVVSFSNSAVISIDLGTEWMKVGIVSPGMPLEIALNKESKRKTPVAIAFRNGERNFGEEAVAIGVRFPKNCYTHLTDLLGKSVEHPSVKRYQKMFPYHEIVPHPARQTVMFKHESGELYTVEELVGEILAKAVEYAKIFSKEASMAEVVIAVPPYFNQAERRAVLKAADIGNIKVLQLMNTNAAVGLNFGVSRIKDWNESARYFLFFDMGASSTVATVVAYHTTKSAEGGKSLTSPKLSILGVGVDRTLGGVEIQRRLQWHLAKVFNNKNDEGTKTDVTENPRALAKLFIEAGRVKNILSANTEHYAQIEGLLDKKDFKYLVTRTELEQLSDDLLDRLEGPIFQALKLSGLTIDRLEQVILVGGNTRMPAVQKRLTELTGRVMSKTINADEACTLGALYLVSDLSSSFKVKKFFVQDLALTEVNVHFERYDEEKKEVNTVKKTLYSFMNPFPQKKILTFIKQQEDFEFYINYALTERSEFLPPKLNVSVVKLKGVKQSIQKNTANDEVFKGIKVHFNLDESGILHLDTIESTYQKVPIDAIFPKNTEVNTIGTNSTLINSSVTKKGNPPKAIDIKEKIAFEESFLDLPDFTSKDFESIMSRVRRINNADKLKQEKEHVFNLLQEYTLDVKNRIYYDKEYVALSTDKERDTIYNKCSEIVNWLDEKGFDSTTEVLHQKLADIKAVTSNLEFRVAEAKNRDEAVFYS